MKPMEHNSFSNEALETINRIQNDNRMLPELNWFLAAAAARFDKHYLESRNPQVIVIGDDIPAEILYAVCDRPFYVLGGSLETAHWADELTPRDTDPFSRSSLGWLLNPAFDLTENALVVTARTAAASWFPFYKAAAERSRRSMFLPLTKAKTRSATIPNSCRRSPRRLESIRESASTDGISASRSKRSQKRTEQGSSFLIPRVWQGASSRTKRYCWWRRVFTLRTALTNGFRISPAFAVTQGPRV